MSENRVPVSYADYHAKLQKVLSEQYAIGAKAKTQGLDPSLEIESPLALDLADRVAKLLEIPVADRLRELLSENRTEVAALTLAREIASGKYPLPEGQNPAEVAVRVGLAIVTDGVTVAPIQGVSAVRTKQNQNGSEYLSVEFAGPIRSAGGTESALTLVIADQVRKTLGLEKYNASAYDDEVGRFVEELRIYERDVGNFQYKVTDRDIQKSIENLPVEIDGVWTDNYEVVVHRDMKRISTNKVRGGALRVLNDGVVGKSKKLLKLLAELNIDGWGWLSELSGGKQQGTDETKQSSSHFEEVISGRPVLSMPGKAGGFRLRYGRAPNTGIHAIGIHPAVCTILNFPIVMGTQIKVDMPGKGASIAIVDTLETPIVRLKDGNVLRVKSAEHAALISQQLDSILYLGDILISFGDFLENNYKLVPSPYVEEWWAIDFETALQRRYSSLDSAEQELGIAKERIQTLTRDPLHIHPTFDEARVISSIMQIPLHPKYLYYWDQLGINEIIRLCRELDCKELEAGVSIQGDIALKPLLEKLGIEHSPLSENQVIVTGEAARVLAFCLNLNKGSRNEIPTEGWSTSVELVSVLAGIQIKNKSSAFVGVRVGRPEKAMPRKMRPPVQGLFPVGRSVGMSRDILVASEKAQLSVELANLECPKCGNRAITSKCSFCNVQTVVFKACVQCGKRWESTDSKCPACGGQLKFSASSSYPLKQELRNASLRVNYTPQKPLKGVLGLTNELKIPERLEKVLLRQKHDLSVYRDGTIRFDATNVPLTHFKPKQIQTSVQTLKELGYTRDIHGAPLEREDQTIEMFNQDVVIPFEAGTFLVDVAKYIDDLLVTHYNMEPYYNVQSVQDMLGHLIIGLAPHTSVGIVGRVIGYTNAQACFATPYWHSAKRRDCDGDGDSILLAMDVLLNFSKRFLPSIIGGLMDAPLLIQPLILPKEVQRQAHHMDIATIYPLEFYELAEKKVSPAEAAKHIELIKDRLGSEKQYCDFGFTHDTDVLTVKQNRSSYSTLVTLTEKLDRQIQIAQKINAVNPDDVVKSVLRTHLLPDIIGNTKAYTSQRFRCKDCSTKYRRMPIKGVCLSCGGPLQASVTRGSVEKYLQLGLRLSSKYDVGEYLRSRFVLASEELATLFKPDGHQSDINDYFSITESDKGQEIEPQPNSDESTAKEQGVSMSNIQAVNQSIEQKKKMKPLEQHQTTLF
ncbi:MAG: DNA polymerase II large subunit [Nitrososphaerota archaeon]|nr:DNA polymerase II large subunit [Nitrososphaerota archaeon]